MISQVSKDSGVYMIYDSVTLIVNLLNTVINKFNG